MQVLLGRRGDQVKTRCETLACDILFCYLLSMDSRVADGSYEIALLAIGRLSVSDIYCR